MPEPWAISGVDLLVEVSTTRVRAGLEAGLRDAIQSGRLPAGTRLPSSRQLAADLGLARNTIAEAYGQLVAEGWLTALQGSGTHVAHRATALPGSASSVEVRPTAPYDLRPGLPNLAAFPATAWVTALRRALLAAPAEALGYGDPRGRPELREALTAYLARTRGVITSPDRVVVCSGFTQGLALLAQVLRDRGATTIAMEGYGQPTHRTVVAKRGLVTRSLAVDQHGACVDDLDQDDAAVLTPAHQFPLGPPLSPARRAAAVAWAARRADSLIIEDDYDGEFRYDRHPVGALQPLAPDRVAYLGTASKTLAPGVRLGWLVAPAGWLDELVAAKAINDAHSSSLDQLALAHLITSGGYDRHLRRCRHNYQRRRDQLNHALRDPSLHLSGIAAGMHSVLSLPEHLDETSVIGAAARRGLALEGLHSYWHDVPRQAPALVVGYGTPPDHAYSGALARLVAALQLPNRRHPDAPRANG